MDNLGVSLVQFGLLGYMLKFIVDSFFKMNFVNSIVSEEGSFLPGVNLKRIFVVVLAGVFCYITGFEFVIPVLQLQPPFPGAARWIDIIFTAFLLSQYAQFMRGFAKQQKENTKIANELKQAQVKKINGG